MNKPSLEINPFFLLEGVSTRSSKEALHIHQKQHQDQEKDWDQPTSRYWRGQQQQQQQLQSISNTDSHDQVNMLDHKNNANKYNNANTEENSPNSNSEDHFNMGAAKHKRKSLEELISSYILKVVHKWYLADIGGFSVSMPFQNADWLTTTK